jgi:pantothenate kinase-related protein Tda10
MTMTSRPPLVDALSVAPVDRDDVLAAAALRGRRARWVSGFCELPRGVADFTAGENEMEMLRRLAAEDQPGSVVLISGPPGTGKTTLAIRVAELWAARFATGASSSTGAA